jgi:acetyl esterase
MLRKIGLVLVTAIVIGTGAYAAFQISPWPSVLLIRYAFDKGGAAASASIAPLVPRDVSVQRDLGYSPGDRDAVFDLFTPVNANVPLPAIVWVHGGGFVAGSRSHLSNYLQILAGRGFVTVAIDSPHPYGRRTARWRTSLRMRIA